MFRPRRIGVQSAWACRPGGVSNRTTAGAGIAQIADPKAFKETYRDQLDAASWDAEERERVIDEVLLAYRFNTELFEDLSAAKAAA
jgi:heme oxygenase